MALRDWLDAREARRWLRSCDSVGAGARLHGRPSVTNEGRLEIGAGFQLASTPIQSHLAVWPGAHLVIGDDVIIGHGAAIACISQVTIGAGSRIGAFLVLADSDFHVAGDRNAQPVPRAIVIGRGVHIGARCNILPGSVLPDGAVVPAGATVRRTRAGK
jgi:acetyltransferase-like isoleucine patch superfamily enzyme